MPCSLALWAKGELKLLSCPLFIASYANYFAKSPKRFPFFSAFSTIKSVSLKETLS